tara:strand:+ start:2558 stop:2737 length:180 start_codon:yes stop_codon:yes gene_type:complete
VNKSTSGAVKDYRDVTGRLGFVLKKVKTKDGSFRDALVPADKVAQAEFQQNMLEFVNSK